MRNQLKSIKEDLIGLDGEVICDFINESSEAKSVYSFLKENGAVMIVKFNQWIYHHVDDKREIGPLPIPTTYRELLGQLAMYSFRQPNERGNRVISAKLACIVFKAQVLYSDKGKK